MILNFDRPDGSIKEKSLYTYINKYPNNPEVIKLLNCPGKSKIEKYKNYKTNISNQNINNNDYFDKTVDYETNTSVSTVILPLKNNYTEEDLLKAHGYDPTIWKILRHQSSKWNSGINVLMASKIVVNKRNVLEGSPSSIIERINKSLKLPRIDFSKNNKKLRNSSKLLVIPISDLHYGLLAEENTSGNDYNMQIAEDRLKDYIQTTIDNININTIDKVLISFGNDYFNCDNVQGTTNRGTPQDNEKSFTTIFDKGVNLGISIVDYLLKIFDKHTQIDVVGVQGNHDLQSSHAMSLALYYNYKDETRVNVDVYSDEKSRYYYNFGENLIGFGHETKAKECHRIMSSECKDWSDYKYRTMFLGHLHKEEVLDTGALVVRRLPILSGRSTWSETQGYDSHPRAQSFIFDSNKGLTNIINVEIE